MSTRDDPLDSELFCEFIFAFGLRYYIERVMKNLIFALFIFISYQLHASHLGEQTSHLQNDLRNRPCHLEPSNFDKWLALTTEQLDSKGRIVETMLGPIQIVEMGKGPVVLALHGGFGGWDQGKLVASTLAENGFRVIIPSRPGYLSTPIFTDPLLLQETTAADQADLMAALLDALKIKKTAVLGFSAGAPVAYEFGLRYPEKTSAVVLESIGANPNEDGFFYALLGAILATETQQVDFLTYLVFLSQQADFYSTALEVLPLDTTLTGAALQRRNEFVICHKNQYNFLYRMISATIPLSPRLLGTLNDFLGVDFWTTIFNPPSPIEYSLPTLIIQAINDSNGFYPTAVTVHQALPTSKLISVKESGHFIWLGPHTKNWERKLIKFLKKNE